MSHFLTSVKKDADEKDKDNDMYLNSSFLLLTDIKLYLGVHLFTSSHSSLKKESRPPNQSIKLPPPPSPLSVGVCSLSSFFLDTSPEIISVKQKTDD